jgi:hypothetical protein
MAKKQKPADAAKDKAAKQKKIAIGLVCFLALAVAYAAHTMMSLNGGAGSKPVAADTTAAATTPAAATPAPTAAAPTLGGDPAADPAAVASPTGSTALVSAVSPTADPGQLQSFSHFESRDPFAGGAASVSGGSSSGTSGGSGSSGSSGSSGGSSGSGSSAPPAVPPAPPNPPPTTAVIAVNGVSESVATSAIFPTTNPTASLNGVFELVSLTAKTATISVVGGSYASGGNTLTLSVNKPVTLQNTADGTRYTLLLYPQGTAPPAVTTTGSPGATSGGSAPPVSTTPASTTPTTPAGP